MTIEASREQLLEEGIALRDEQIKSLTGSSAEVGALMSVGNGITHKQATILCILIKRSPAIVTRQSFHLLMYGERDDGGPEPKIFDIHISRIRKLMRRAGIPGHIDTVVNAGYKADTELVNWARELMTREGVM
jgi:Response regulators consisting of a CheY-like receiver domain and a winged-helix DNA-binding domain